MIKAVIFDAYGTLISTGSGSVEAAGRILALNGRCDISPRDFYAAWKRLHRGHISGLQSFVCEAEIFETDLRELYKRYGMTRDAREDAAVMLDTLGKRTAFPEAKEVLDRLSRSYVTAVGSTTDTEPLLRDMARGGLTVTRVFTSESLRVYKPKKEFYLRILSALGVTADEALFVGDSPTDDVAGPAGVGMRTCFINRRGIDAGDIVPTYEISDLRQLYDILYNHET